MNTTQMTENLKTALYVDCLIELGYDAQDCHAALEYYKEHNPNQAIIDAFTQLLNVVENK